MGSFDRRRLLRLAAGVPALALPDLLVVRHGTVTAPPELFDAWESQLRDVVDGYERRSVAATAVRIRRELPLVRSLLLAGRQGADERRRLHWTAGRFGALRAATRTDLGDRVGGLAAFAEAYGHAHAAGDHPTMSWVRCWQSTLARKNGDLSNALALARDAGRWAGPEHPVAARAAVVEAMAHACRGEVRETHEAVGKAWRVVGTLDGDQHGVPGFSGPDSMHTTSIAEMTAGAYVDLGFPNIADVYVQAALPDLEAAGATGRRSLIRMSGATAAVKQGDAERGVELVNEALTISESRPTVRITERAGQFLGYARQTAGWLPMLDDLEERLRTWGVPPV